VARISESAVVFEGDNALRIDPTSLLRRALAMPATDLITISHHVRFDPGARLVAYTETAGFDFPDEASQAANWAAEGSCFSVLDGLNSSPWPVPR
jgi:hypothetical protein